MEDDHTLQDYGVTVSTAKAQAPAQLGLTCRWVSFSSAFRYESRPLSHADKSAASYTCFTHNIHLYVCRPYIHTCLCMYTRTYVDLLSLHVSRVDMQFSWQAFYYCGYRNETGDFETLDITPYSAPPDLPEVMKNQEASNGQEQVA